MRKRKIIVSIILSIGLFFNYTTNFNSQVQSPAKTVIGTFEDVPIDGKH